MLKSCEILETVTGIDGKYNIDKQGGGMLLFT